ncbi:MAG TPA: hypothetical protein PL059_12760 [Spirochaetota bacterium]|nr:hypothetical protein [Spirochaetota bacterium]HOM11095.1 hypothetical protein [Spirochaetota bacterium]HPP51104.1 hypothetical protein [Spirochaetota bacterium]HXK65680.1 hypothetical protein [Spirochaetota bacterium]
MIKYIIPLLLVVCAGCTQYVDVGDVEFSVQVVFQQNVPVFATTYTITLLNTSINKVVKNYTATVAIVTEDKHTLKQLTFATDKLLPKQVQQITITQNESEEAIKPLFNELEIDINEVIKQQEAALVLPEGMVKVEKAHYETVDIVTYLQEVGQ